MKKLFLLVALTGAAVAAYCVTPANASTTEARQAKADVYKMSSNLVILPEYGASETVYILKNGWEVSRDTDWSLDAQPFNFRRAAIRNRIGHHIDQYGRQSR